MTTLGAWKASRLTVALAAVGCLTADVVLGALWGATEGRETAEGLEDLSVESGGPSARTQGSGVREIARKAQRQFDALMQTRRPTGWQQQGETAVPQPGRTPRQGSAHTPRQGSAHTPRQGSAHTNTRVCRTPRQGSAAHLDKGLLTPRQGSAHTKTRVCRTPRQGSAHITNGFPATAPAAVSYTHLTLPTIYSV